MPTGRFPPEEAVLRSDTNIISEIFCKSLVSVFFCLILGVAFYQWLLFNIHYPSFQIVLYGILGSLFFFSLQVNVRNSFALLLVMFVVQSGLLTRSFRLGLLTRDIVFVAAVGASIYLYFIAFYRRTLQLRHLHPLVLGTMFVLAFSLATVILELIERRIPGLSGGRLLWALQINAINGFLIGLGIGVGILMIDNGYVTWTRIMARRLFGSIVASFRDFGDRL